MTATKRHLGIRSTRPVDTDTRWLAYYLPDGRPSSHCCGRDQIAGEHGEIALLVRRGCKFVGVFGTAKEACAATEPAPTQEEQSVDIIAGLTASLIGEELRKKQSA